MIACTEIYLYDLSLGYSEYSFNDINRDKTKGVKAWA